MVLYFDNFTRYKKIINPVTQYCNEKKCMSSIMYQPVNTGGNAPSNVKAMQYAQYVKRFSR